MFTLGSTPQVRECAVKDRVFAGRMTEATLSVTLTPMTPIRWTAPVPQRKWSVEGTQMLVTVHCMHMYMYMYMYSV